ncbi:MAG: PAS domain S-box protein [Spirochaetes bacterium]|nr:PAS domain S-box protein [Spirochaetota bacterium]
MNVGYFSLLYGAMVVIVAVTIPVTILREGVESRLSRAFVGLAVSLILWNLGYTLMSLTDSPDLARTFYRFSVLGWGPFVSFMTWFVYQLYNYYYFQRGRAWVTLILFLPAPVIIYGGLTGRLLASGFTRTDAGWIETVDPSSPWTVVFMVLLVLFTAITFGLMIHLWIRAKTNKQRLQAKLIILPVLFTEVLSLLFNGIIPMVGASPLPAMAQILFSVWIVFVAVSLVRYPLLSVTPQIAAETIVETMSDLCILTDTGGVILRANPPVQGLLGLDPAVMAGRHIAEFLPRELCDLSLGRLERPEQALETVINTVGGERIPCSCHVRMLYDRFNDPIGSIIMVHEIRRRRMLEDIIIAMTDSLVLLDAGGCVVSANRALEELTGYREEELRGRPAAGLLSDWGLSGEFLQDGAAGGAFQNRELSIRTKDGRDVPVLFSSSILRDDWGSPAGIVCIARDITARKEAELQLRAQNDEIQRQADELQTYAGHLRHANELLMEKQGTIEAQSRQLMETNRELSVLNSTKDRLFSIIGHDLRNPFHAMRGYAEMLIADPGAVDVQSALEFARLIYDAADRAGALLENLLQWSLSQTGRIAFRPAEIDLAAAVRETLRLLEGAAGAKRIEVRTGIDGALRVRADENMLKAVLRNLVSNAVKFTGEGGAVTLSARRNGILVEIAVADTGVGIPAERLGLLFDIETNRSTVGTANEKGTGIGLVLCREFVERQGGTIRAESGEGRGSTFTFTLPAAR